MKWMHKQSFSFVFFFSRSVSKFSFAFRFISGVRLQQTRQQKQQQITQKNVAHVHTTIKSTRIQLLAFIRWYNLGECDEQRDRVRTVFVFIQLHLQMKQNTAICVWLMRRRRRRGRRPNSYLNTYAFRRSSLRAKQVNSNKCILNLECCWRPGTIAENALRKKRNESRESYASIVLLNSNDFAQNGFFAMIEEGKKGRTTYTRLSGNNTVTSTKKQNNAKPI